MIVKKNLDPMQVARYTARPMAWAAAWAVIAPAAYALSGDARLLVPFAPVGTLGAALAFVVAFRNSSAIGRWNEARAAWQAVLIACRTLLRVVVAATDNAVAANAVDDDAALRLRREVAGHLVAYSRAVADRVRPNRIAHGRTLRVEDLAPDLALGATPDQVLTALGMRIRFGIRTAALAPTDTIPLEAQLGALSAAQGTIERIATTPTPRQYDYFTRRTVQLFALLAPFGVLSLVPEHPWLAAPLALTISGAFIMLAVTGAANDEPFASAATDVPIEAVCTQVEIDLATALSLPIVPGAPMPVDGYLW